MRMNKGMVMSEWRKWIEDVGGIKAASQLISEKLECSLSKAEKLAAGRYPSSLVPAEQKELANLMSKSRDGVFRPLAGSKSIAS